MQLKRHAVRLTHIPSTLLMNHPSLPASPGGGGRGLQCVQCTQCDACLGLIRGVHDVTHGGVLGDKMLRLSDGRVKTEFLSWWKSAEEILPFVSQPHGRVALQWLITAFGLIIGNIIHFFMDSRGCVTAPLTGLGMSWTTQGFQWFCETHSIHWFSFTGITRPNRRQRRRGAREEDDRKKP